MKSPDDVYAASPRALPRTVGTRIPLPRPRHLVTACGRICMHRKKSTSRPCSPASGSASTTLTRHLARQLHAPRPRLNRPGTENLADHRQPVPHQVVTHVLGTICHPCLRAGQDGKWRSERSAAAGRRNLSCKRLHDLRKKPLVSFSISHAPTGVAAALHAPVQCDTRVIFPKVLLRCENLEGLVLRFPHLVDV